MSTRRPVSINAKDPNAIQRIIEALEVADGVRGNAEDRKPTIGEVRKMLTGQVQIAGSGGSIGGGSGLPVAVGGGTTPPRPTSVAASALREGIYISWAKPNYEHHGTTEVWRSASNNLTGAQSIGFTASNYFIDFNAGNSQTFFYFVRHAASVAYGGGTGPFTAGIQATSAAALPSPAETLQAAQQHANAGDAATLLAAQQYADTGDSQTLQAAQQYTDQQIAQIPTPLTPPPNDGKLYGMLNGQWVEIP